MTKPIVVIQGHPDSRGGHFGHALAQAYREGAEEAGHKIELIEVARLDFPLLQNEEDWKTGAPSEAIGEAQKLLARAKHWVIIYPLWLGGMPAILKAFFEQILRPGFAITPLEGGKRWQRHLRGKSARIVVTMGMPALLYRWYFGAHSLKSLERNILGFCGIAPIKESLIGMVASMSDSKREKWLEKMRELGRSGQ
ncbi:MAG: NAD(P)H-dependent oxidoreductase [Methylothermaceae bacterium]|nr:NAD(P)H-dependent oxidoreductase [Methylothermaceae bacterium]